MIRDGNKSDDPAEALAAVVALRREADRLERNAIDEALARGWTWSLIAQALGVTRQAAHKRHAKRIAARSSADNEGGSEDARTIPTAT